MQETPPEDVGVNVDVGNTNDVGDTADLGHTNDVGDTANAGDTADVEDTAGPSQHWTIQLPTEKITSCCFNTKEEAEMLKNTLMLLCIIQKKRRMFLHAACCDFFLPVAVGTDRKRSSNWITAITLAVDFMYSRSSGLKTAHGFCS